jgi:hypothetical protein
VEHLGHPLVGHQAEQRLQIDLRRDRVDHDRLVGACHLHDAELRPEGGLAQELRVDADKRIARKPLAGGGKLGGGGDEVHARDILRETATNLGIRSELRKPRGLVSPRAPAAGG